jgi:uncharacterized protein YjbJ (UPF0337 family)
MAHGMYEFFVSPTIDNRSIIMVGFKDKKWDEIKGSITTEWSKLNDGDVRQINGHAEKLVTAIKDKYSVSQTEAQQQVQDFIDKKQPAAV